MTKHYMDRFWENRLAECVRGREDAEKHIGRIALLEMEQLTIPLEQYMPGVIKEDNGE